MNAGDWALLIAGSTGVAVGLPWLLIRSGYQVSAGANFKISKQVPPREPKPKPAEQSTVTDIAARGAA